MPEMFTESVPSLRFRIFPATALALVLAATLVACGITETDPLPQSSRPVGSIAIFIGTALNNGTLQNAHTGDTITLGVMVRDVIGFSLPFEPVTWTSGNELRGTALPYGRVVVRRTVSISQNGVVTDPANFFIYATAGNKTDSAPLDFNGWDLALSTDPVTLKNEGAAALSARLSAEGPPQLHVRCDDGKLDVYVSTSFPAANGTVQYRFNGENAVTASWSAAADFHSVFAPDANDSTFARKLAQHDSLIFSVNKSQGGSVTAEFVLHGAAEVVDPVIAACRS